MQIFQTQNIRIVGKLEGLEKVHAFSRDLYKMKIQIKYSHNHIISTIVYADIMNTFLENIPTGNYVSIVAYLATLGQYTSKCSTKKFLVFYAESINTINTNKYCNSINIQGKVKSTPKIEVVKDVTYVTFQLGIKTSTNKKHVIWVSCRNDPAKQAQHFNVGDNISINGFFKTKRHHMKVFNQDFEFDTFIVAAKRFLQN